MASITDPVQLAAQQGIRNARSAAAAAQSTADAAQSAANSALMSADGKNTIHYQATAPTGVAHKVGDTWFNSANGHEIARWDGSSWVPAELGEGAIADLAITNAKIANLDGGKIVAGSIDTLQLNADAIDGMVITGATLRTAASGQRVQIDSANGLRGFNAANELKTSIGSDGTIKAVDGEFSGVFRTGGASDPGVAIRPYPASGTPSAGIVEYSGPASVGAAIYLRTNNVRAVGAQLSGGAGSVSLVGSSEGNGITEIVGSEAFSAGYSGVVNIRGKSAGASGSGAINLTGTINFTDTATKQSARNSLGLGNTTGALPVANGGTGVTTAAAERSRLGLGNTTGALPIANGGTGATTAAGIRAAIGVGAVQDADFSGSITLTSAVGGLSGVFTLPSGMTQSNTMIYPSKQGDALAKYIPYVKWVSSTTFQIGLYSGDGSVGAGNVIVAAYARRIS